MKFTVEVELETLVENDPNLPKDIIRDQLIRAIKSACNSSPEDEVWIDISDDGDEKFNIYRILNIS